MASKKIDIFKLVAALVVGFIAFIFAASFIFSNEFSTERSVVIEIPKEEVFDYIRYLENQYNYSVWGAMDPNMSREFRGTDGTVGFISAWEGNEDVGRGEQEIVGIEEGERIDYELRFFEPFESTSDAYMVTESVGDGQTRVIWGMAGTFPRPMNLMMLFMDLEGMIGSDYETGLNNLKAILEESGIEEES
ncbi:MAG: SRPBCC family protein [Balneolaceae bacterium]|nr:SRPBCC family protein [Balneolaceae bacterium]